MSTERVAHWNRVRFGILGVVAALFALALGAGAMASATSSRSDAPKPTIVLVHGAFADASSWNGVTERLQDKGYTVIAPANPLRNLASDGAYLSSILDTVTGPVVLVGHSYGGMVLTNAANGHRGVKALVYIAAFAPDAGETAGGLTILNPGSGLGPQNLVVRPYPGGLDGYIKPSVFPQLFAGDVPRETAAIMAGSQRPSDLGILTQPSGQPAWKTIPSWFMVATHDMLIPPATERFMAHRAGATTVEVSSSHVAMISHPDAVEDLIVSAANTVH
jgi:pimeloyl-ACP methyl ester carboxylesterase